MRCHSPNSQRRPLLFATMLLLLVGALVAPAAAADCPGNVALNPGLEHGFTERGAGEVVVANGWFPWWQDGPGQDDGQNWRPEFKPEDASRFGRRRIHEGNWGQKWHNTYATHNAGIYQTVGVPPHSVVSAVAWAQAWSSAKDDPDVSKDGGYELSIGIDPTGGSDGLSDKIVWSPLSTTLDEWVKLEVQAKAEGDRITLFLRGHALWPVKHNDAYFDDICLTYVQPTPTNTPPPSETPLPTATPEPEDTAAPTPEDTPVPEPTAVPVEDETPRFAGIHVSAFEDGNENGLREEGEPLVAGALIEVQDMGRNTIVSHTTDGTSEPYAIMGLEPGQYIVVETDPQGYRSSAPNQWGVALLAGTEVEIAFADTFGEEMSEPTLAPTSTPRPTATLAPTKAPMIAPTPPPAPPSSSKGDWFKGVSGIVVATLALVLPVALRFIRVRV